MGPDPFDLARFVDAQAADYSRALEELRGGRKRSLLEQLFDGEVDRTSLKLMRAAEGPA